MESTINVSCCCCFFKLKSNARRHSDLSKINTYKVIKNFTKFLLFAKALNALFKSDFVHSFKVVGFQLSKHHLVSDNY